MSHWALASIAFVLAAAGCAGSAGAPASEPRGAGQPPEGVPLGNPRYFQLTSDDSFWVTHDAERDRVVSSGVRLELSPSGEVLASSWESDKAHNGDLLQGGVALPPHLGGGYVFWTTSRVMRAAEFAGPMQPVSLGIADAADTTIRGVRIGLRGAFIATDTGPRELLPGATSTTPFPDPGVTDLAAIDASRAIRLDALGRSAWTVDGGKTWTDATHVTGFNVRNLVAAADEVWFETWQGRVALRKEGPLSEPEGHSYRYVDYARPFMMVHRGTRADRDESYWHGYRDLQPLQAALASGVRLRDGSGFGVVRGVVSRVDLATGKVLSVATDWLPNGIECQPIAMGDELLFACTWEDYQSGGYVLRGDGTSPPRVERLFTDYGAFIADDAGGFGFTGSCQAEDKYVDPERYYGRYGYDGEDGPASSVDPVFCVRRGPDDWVEHRITLDDDTQIVAWIPKKDGTAVAIVRGTGRGVMLPEVARGSQRDSAQNGVRVVRVSQESWGWTWGTQQVRSYYGRSAGPSSLIDRRYRVLDDGTIVAWVSSNDMEDRYQPVSKFAGAALRPDGRTEVFDLPAAPVTMAVAGPFGMLTSRDGKVFETLDRGRTWRAAGLSPLAPFAMQGLCSALGCAFATGARVGWGAAALSPEVIDEKRAEPQKGKLHVPAIVCEPDGAPKAEQSNLSPAAAALGSQSKLSIPTNFGATLELVRETPDALTSASPYPYSRHPWPPPAPSPAATASASAPQKAAAKAAPVRTHTLVFRPPLDPLAPIVRHNATNAAVTGYRGRNAAIPLLGANGEVSLHYFADQKEALVDRNDIVTMPFFETRRYYYYDSSGAPPGLRTASNRALLFGDFRRRGALEEHGTAPQKPPFYFTFDREANRRRPIALARRDDGAIGLVILDSAAPDVASLVPFDRVATALGSMTRLASWATLATADSPACAADKKAYRALLFIDPSVWLTLDGAKLPGVTLGKQGLMMVRWSEERVCLEGVDVAVNDPRRRPDSPAGENLVIRWTSAGSGKSTGGDAPARVTGALRSLELMQPLTCSLQPPPK